jgi:hypothetical protein
VKKDAWQITYDMRSNPNDNIAERAPNEKKNAMKVKDDIRCEESCAAKYL